MTKTLEVGRFGSKEGGTGRGRVLEEGGGLSDTSLETSPPSVMAVERLVIARRIVRIKRYLRLVISVQAWIMSPV
jgi:hypothetical protein